MCVSVYIYIHTSVVHLQTNMYRFWVFALLCTVGFVVEGAKILAIFPGPGYSQYFVGEPLILHLAKQGHQVTLVSFYKPKEAVKNVIPIQVERSKELQDGR